MIKWVSFSWKYWGINEILHFFCKIIGQHDILHLAKICTCSSPNCTDEFLTGAMRRTAPITDQSQMGVATSSHVFVAGYKEIGANRLDVQTNGLVPDEIALQQSDC